MEEPDEYAVAERIPTVDESVALREAPSRAYVNLLADVDGFYERFGFEDPRPGPPRRGCTPGCRDRESVVFGTG